MLSKAEARVSTWIQREFNLKPRGDPGDLDRGDFFCVAVGGTLHIVEIKRGAFVAKEKEFLQADKYRKYVTKRFAELTDPKAIKYGLVQCHLISASLHRDADSIKQAYADKGWVFFTTWDDLIERAKQSHIQFRDILQKRAGEASDAGDDSGLTDSGGVRKRKRKRKAGVKATRKKKARKKK